MLNFGGVDDSLGQQKKPSQNDDFAKRLAPRRGNGTLVQGGAPWDWYTITIKFTYMNG